MKLINQLGIANSNYAGIQSSPIQLNLAGFQRFNPTKHHTLPLFTIHVKCYDSDTLIINTQ